MSGLVGRMSDVVDSLLLDLLEWIAQTPRPYAEVMEAWRTSCPRLSVWEDANELGFIERRRDPGGGQVICVSQLGWDYLRMHRTATEQPIS